MYPTYGELVTAITDGVAGNVRLRFAPGGTPGSASNWGETPFFETGNVDDF